MAFLYINNYNKNKIVKIFFRFYVKLHFLTILFLQCLFKEICQFFLHFLFFLEFLFNCINN